MNNNEDRTTIGPGVIIAVVSVFVAVVSIGSTLLLYNMDEVRKKADKTDSNDRWTATMERITTECAKEKAAMHDTSQANARDALEWKTRFYQCEANWELHREVCGCNHKQQDRGE